jgi:hypothetical protein
MEQEGFSGHDGRTTIFDYWSVGTLCRAAAKKLTAEEKQLADTYKKVLTIARKEKAVVEGAFYDLMYVNPDCHRQYMFLRRASKTSQLLVVANFDDNDATVSVRIPQHAFEFLNMSEGTYTATDLLNGGTQELMLNASEAARIQVAARSAVVLKLKLL